MTCCTCEPLMHWPGTPPDSLSSTLGPCTPRPPRLSPLAVDRGARGASAPAPPVEDPVGWLPPAATCVSAVALGVGSPNVGVETATEATGAAAVDTGDTDATGVAAAIAAGGREKNITAAVMPNATNPATIAIGIQGTGLG